MISGSACWNRACQRGMELQDIAGREVYTFKGMASSLYHLLRNTAERTPDAVAIVDDWGRKTPFA